MARGWFNAGGGVYRPVVHPRAPEPSVAALDIDAGGPSPIVGDSSGVSAPTAIIFGLGLMVGSASGASSPAGTITGQTDLIGSASGVSAPAGTITGQTDLVGSASGLSAPFGTVIGLTTLVGSASGSSAPTGSIRGDAYGVGSASGTSAPAGTIAGLTTLVGSASGLSAPDSVLVNAAGPSLIVGDSSGTSAPTGVVVGLTSLTGSASGSSTPTGIAIGLTSLVGSSSGTSAPAGTIIGLTGVVGSSSGASAPTGTVFGIGFIAGTASGLSTPTGAIIDAAAPAVDGSYVFAGGGLELRSGTNSGNEFFIRADGEWWTPSTTERLHVYCKAKRTTSEGRMFIGLLTDPATATTGPTAHLAVGTTKGMCFYTNASDGSGLTIRGAVRNAGSLQESTASVKTLTINTWHEFKILHTGTGVEFYIDGTLEDTLSTEEPTSGDMTPFIGITYVAGDAAENTLLVRALDIWKEPA